MSVNASVDQSIVPERPTRARLPVVLIVLFFSAILIGGATAAEASPASAGLTNVVTVVAFVGGMVTVAFCMIGDPRR